MSHQVATTSNYFPGIEGLSFRHPTTRGGADAIAIAELIAACAAVDAVDPLSTMESIPNTEVITSTLAQAGAAGLEKRLIAEVKNRMVGYGVIEDWHEEDGRWVYQIHIRLLPEWRRKGIGTAMLGWSEQKVSQLAPNEHPGEPYELSGYATSTQTGAAAFLIHAGYAYAFTQLEMDLDRAAPLPDCSLPQGVEIRPVQPEHILPIAESIAASYRDEFPGGRFRQTHSEVAGQAEWYNHNLPNSALWQVAWVGDLVVGQVLPLIERGRAVIDEVSVRPDWRRKGLARALLTRALVDLRLRRVDLIRLNTVAEFPTRAMDLYASLGFRVLKEFRQYRKSPPGTP